MELIFHINLCLRGVVLITTAQLHTTKPEFSKPGSAQVQTRYVWDLRWWGSPTMVPAGNKAKRLSSVNHTAKTIYHHHLHHHRHHHLLLTNRQVANFRKAYYLSTDIKLSKLHLSKMILSGWYLGRLVDPLLKAGLSLMKNVIQPLAKSVLIPLGLTAAASAPNGGIHKKILGSSNKSTTLIISNGEWKTLWK